MAANHCSSLGGLRGNSLEGFSERLCYWATLLSISPRTLLPSGQTGSVLLPDHLGREEHPRPQASVSLCPVARPMHLGREKSTAALLTDSKAVLVPKPPASRTGDPVGQPWGYKTGCRGGLTQLGWLCSLNTWIPSCYEGKGITPKVECPLAPCCSWQKSSRKYPSPSSPKFIFNSTIIHSSTIPNI